MNKILIFFIFCVVTRSYGSELPNDAQRLLEKRDEAVKIIDRRFVEELERLKVTHTKRGDLDSANAIANLIEKLKIDQDDSSDVAFRNRIINTTWTWWGQERITFLPNGKARWSHNGKEVFTWRVASVSDRVISGTTPRGELYRITFADSLAVGKILEGDRVRDTSLIPNK